MDIQRAQELSRDYVKRGMRKLQVHDALIREGYDVETVKEVMADFEELRTASLNRKRGLIQFGGAALFISCGALFLYFAFFPTGAGNVAHFWLLVPAMLGLLKMLLP